MTDIALNDSTPMRLIRNANGRHCFGGKTAIEGATPTGTNVPVQLVLDLDLTDPEIPISCDGVTRLPLIHPFKYGGGGGELQYRILGDRSVEILWISDSEPDATDEQYLDIDTLPEVRFSLAPLNYEQARVVSFFETNTFFQPSAEDRAILDDLYQDSLILIGGPRQTLRNAAYFQCRNPQCSRHNQVSIPSYFALIPAIDVDSSSEFWCEFDADVTFYFALCPHCHTIFTSNACS